MSEEKRCAQCGAALAADAPHGLCPACLLKRGFASSTGASESNNRGARTEYVPPPAAELAEHFPELEILGLVGRGGMGVVYKARQKRLDRLVALKILPPNVSRDAAFSERFSREAKALARLTHPNIVTVHDFGQTNGLFYFVMEFVDGMNLRQLLDAGKISPKEALAIVPQICDALQYAHDKGIVHRDIKPENILLAKDGTVKIADFGLAKLVGLEAKDLTITSARDVIGTPLYMAPEQVEHPQDVDHRADIYSLGVVFYQMLTGELPIGRFAAPSRKVQIDVRLDEVVLRALEKEPDQRYQHASDVKTQVETIATTSPSKDSGVVSPPPTLTQPRRTNKRFLWALWICLAAWFLIQWWSKRESTGVWLPTRMSDSIGEQYGEAQVRVIDVIQRGQVVLIKLVCDTSLRDHELFVRYSGPIFDYPTNIVAQVTNLESKVDCLMSPSFQMLGGRRDDVLAGSRELRGASTYLIGFVLPDATVAARVVEQVRRVHLGRPSGFKDSPSAILLFALHRRWGNDANGKPVVESLTGELSWQAKETGQTVDGLPSVAGVGQPLVKSDYIGQAWFPKGDLIEITSVVRTADRISVRGRYSLVSHDTALLALYITSTNNPGPEEARQRMQISKGAGYFDLVHTHLVPGLPHVSMYADDGHPFAALYFGTKAEALEESQAGWITNTPPPSVSTEEDLGQTVAGLPPVVVETQPVSGARNVEPGITEIRVRFSKRMAGGSWSWSTAWENSTPEFITKPRYEADGQTCVARVKLEPGQTYAFWLNSEKFQNFTDRAGRPAVPYLLTFQTRSN